MRHTFVKDWVINGIEFITYNSKYRGDVYE